MAAQQSVAVNLLPRDAFSESFIGKLLLWALSIGRYIVVFTELIVIVSFLSRFKLDRDLTDLNSSIDQQLAVVKSYGDLEPTIRRVQTKTRLIRELTDVTQPHEVVNLVSTMLPVDVRLTKLSVYSDRLELSGISLSAQGFAVFVHGLQQQSTFWGLQVVKIASEDQNDPGIHFDLTAKYGAGRVDTTTLE